MVRRLGQVPPSSPSDAVETTAAQQAEKRGDKQGEQQDVRQADHGADPSLHSSPAAGMAPVVSTDSAIPVTKTPSDEGGALSLDSVIPGTKTPSDEGVEA